jgi:HlyD family secretion protein
MGIKPMPNVPERTAPLEPAVPSPDSSRLPPRRKKQIVAGVVVAAAIAIAVLAWTALKPSGPGAGFISGNGRIEAAEVDVATKLAGRVQAILVNEGDFVKVGQPLAQMQTAVLDAARDEARAQSRQAVDAVSSAEAQVVARRSDKAAAQAVVKERESDLDAAQRRLARSKTLATSGSIALQELDDDRARVRSAEATVSGAHAQVAAAQAAITAARAQVNGAGSGVAATEATVARVEADIEDSQLKSPRDGRVQYRVAQPGEVLAGGGKILNLVDLSDVYLTFFLPETAVGKVALGSEVRVVLDAAPLYVIPAKVSYVASAAQFTPKAVETASERQKLMFRVKAQISPELLKRQMKLVKTGLPGVAWLKLDPQATWPANLAVKVPE